MVKFFVGYIIGVAVVGLCWNLWDVDPLGAAALAALSGGFGIVLDQLGRRQGED